MSSFIYPNSTVRKMYGVQGKKAAWRKKQEQIEMERREQIKERQRQWTESRKQDQKITWFQKLINWVKSFFNHANK